MFYLLALLALAAVTLAAWFRLRRRRHPEVEEIREASPSRAPAPPWVVALSTGELAELCLRLLSRLGYTMLAQTVEGDRAEVTALEVQAIHSREILLRAYDHAAGPVDTEALRETVAHAQDEGAERAMVIGLAGFTAEAERAAQNLPLQLLDGDDLDTLSRQHLPELSGDHATVPPPHPAGEGTGPHLPA